ncbi:hypothetical protein [Candidatus Coxiella mudrowiae]|uniref:hypothetical protein n=1 Tax=Candidatus Coxiella mudrowiae TaxID=2054173 RepID=UPI001FD11673|nr:hypothetical protein [Candidatus Coxiella mudrowiae]
MFASRFESRKRIITLLLYLLSIFLICYQPWEKDFKNPKSLTSPLGIMLQGPIGAASFNNEFGRPNVCGYFLTLEYRGNFDAQIDTQGEIISYGYRKPIMISGGIGQIHHSQVEKQSFEEKALLIVIGGPAMTIGLGGGSLPFLEVVNEATEALDFASGSTFES